MKVLTSLFASIVLTASILPATAGETVKYPTEEPAFSMVLPDKWTAKTNEEGQLVVAAGDDSGFYVTILAAKEGDIKGPEDTKIYLPKLTKIMADAAQLKEVNVRDEKTLENEQKITFHLVSASGKIEGEELALTTVAFAPTEGDYYVILCAVPAAVDKAHGEQMVSILKSMTPVE